MPRGDAARSPRYVGLRADDDARFPKGHTTLRQLDTTLPRLLISTTIVLAGATACRSGGTNAVAITSDPVDLPPAASAPRHLDELVTDMVAGELCGAIAGSIRGLRASSDEKSDGGPKSAGGPKSDDTRSNDDASSGDDSAASSTEDELPVTGRLWVTSCEVSLDGDRIDARFEGLGWRWVDKREKKLGATFSVEQYARFAIEVRASARVRATYDPDERVAYIWAPMVEPLRVGVTPLGNVDVKTKGSWSDVLGGAADALPMQSLETKAKSKVAKKASTKVAEELDAGFSVVGDLCLDLRQVDTGQIAPDEWARRDWRAEARKPPISTRVKLYPGGLDAGGVLEPKGHAIDIEARVVEGGPVSVELLCEEEARRLAEAFTKGEPPPDATPIASGRATASSPVRFRARAACRAVLVSRPAGDEPAVVELRAETFADRDRPTPCSRRD